MKILPLTLSVLALALGAGCAQTRSTAMGASPSPSASGATPSAASGPVLVCRDGRWTGPGGSCANHGGTERVVNQ
jgi:hypothetical protein